MTIRKPYQRVRPVKDAVFYRAWALAHPFCQCCGVPEAAAPNAPGCGGISLSTHHIVKFKRSDEACNLLRLCQRCHDLAEMRSVRVKGELLPLLYLSVVLTIKRVRDPDAWDPARLEILFGRPLPDPDPVPAFAEESYRRWRPSPFYPCDVIA